MSSLGYIFDIKKFSINDGPGIRTTVFFKGCPLNCVWCHNPESRNMKPESVQPNNYNWSIYSQSCSPDIIGKMIKAEEVIDELIKDFPFYEESGGGVTFSGGEPLLQIEFLFELLQLCKKFNLNTAVDTSGFTPFRNIERVYPFTDLFLFDMKIFDEELHIKYTGVSNRLILENLRRLTEMGKKVIIRIPIIPGVNDNDENIISTINYLKQLQLLQINILPFHNSAVSKYERLGLQYQFKSEKSLLPHDLEKMKIKFSETGTPVIIGG